MASNRRSIADRASEEFSSRVLDGDDVLADAAKIGAALEVNVALRAPAEQREKTIQHLERGIFAANVHGESGFYDCYEARALTSWCPMCSSESCHAAQAISMKQLRRNRQDGERGKQPTIRNREKCGAAHQ